VTCCWPCSRLVAKRPANLKGALPAPRDIKAELRTSRRRGPEKVPDTVPVAPVIVSVEAGVLRLFLAHDRFSLRNENHRCKDAYFHTLIDSRTDNR
jgi:hypothetical protein